MIYIQNSNEKNIFAFTRSSEKDKVLALFNLSNKPAEVELTSEALQGNYKTTSQENWNTFLQRNLLISHPGNIEFILNRNLQYYFS